MKLLLILALVTIGQACTSGNCGRHEPERGPRGLQGPQGAQGAQGAQGPAPTENVIAPGLICPAGGILVGGLPLCNGAGGIVPYANGATPVVLSTLVGLAHLGAVVGFGSSASHVALTAPIVANTTVGNFAFTAPRNLTLNSLYFDYTNALALTLVGATNLVVRTEIYEAVLPSATFTPLSPPLFATGTIVGPVIAIGRSTSGHGFGSVKIIQGTRLLLVASITAPSGTGVATTTGILSAGLGYA